jgi:hypothetical protein
MTIILFAHKFNQQEIMGKVPQVLIYPSRLSEVIDNRLRDDNYDNSNRSEALLNRNMWKRKGIIQRLQHPQIVNKCLWPLRCFGMKPSHKERVYSQKKN